MNERLCGICDKPIAFGERAVPVLRVVDASETVQEDAHESCARREDEEAEERQWNKS